MKKKLGFIYNLVAYVAFPIGVKYFGVDMVKPRSSKGSTSSLGIMEWVKVLRMQVCLMAAFLTIVSFKVCGVLYASVWPAIIVMVICSATMVQNDWRDRANDVKKGKVLASSNPGKFLLFNVLLWLLVAIVMLLGGIIMGWKFVLLPLPAIIVGLLHPNWRRIPIFYPLVVGLTSAAPSLFPWVLGYGNRNMFIFFFLATLIIFCREQIKDLEDYQVDKGYKKTLPQEYGYHATIIVLLVLTMIFSILVAWVSTAFIVTGVLTALSSYLVVIKDSFRASKIVLDIGLIYGLVILYLYS